MKKQRVVRAFPSSKDRGMCMPTSVRGQRGHVGKAQLAAKIAEIVHRRALTQTRTAEILGLTQPKVSAT